MAYTGTVINDLVITTPTEGPTGSRTPEINDAIREIKTCVKTTIGVEHNLTTGMHIYNQATKTTNYTLTTTDGTVFGDATTAAFPLTFPTAVGYAGQRHLIIKIDATANAVNWATTGGQTVGGATTGSLTTQWQAMGVESNGTNWVKWADSTWGDVAGTAKYSTYPCLGVELLPGYYITMARFPIPTVKVLYVRVLGIIQTNGTAVPATVIAQIYNITDDASVSSTNSSYVEVTGVSVAASKVVCLRLYNGSSTLYNLSGFVTVEVI